MELLEVGELHIAYQRVGDGPPVVFVHGAAEDGRIWEPQLVGLASDFTVVAWDEPGAGQSSDLPESFGLTDFSDALAALIRSLGLGPAHVAGLSWGGTVTLELYRRHPELVATLLSAIAADVRPATLELELAIMADTDASDLLPHIAVPTLLIWAQMDARSPLFVARQFDEAIPDTTLVVIEGAGHMSNLEQPGQVNDAVRDFCRSHPPGSG